jgi:hypothetical protein
MDDKKNNDTQQPITTVEPTSQPETPLQAPPATPLGSATNPKRKRKVALIFSAIVVVLLIALGLVYQFWYQNPDKVVTDSIVNAVRAKSVTYTGALEAKGDMAYKVELTGATDKATSDMNAKVSFSLEGKEYTVDASARFDKNADLFIKFKNVDSLLEMFLGTDPELAKTIDQLKAKVEDKWIKVESDALGEFDQEVSKQQDCVSDTIKKFQNDQTVVDEIAKAYDKNRFVQIKENLGSKDGSLGYVLAPDEAKGRAFVKEFKNTKIYKSMVECDKSLEIKEEDKKEGEKAESTTDVRVELWVNQWTHQITKLNATSKDKKDAKQQSSILLNPIFNKEINVETPKDTVSLKDLMQDIQNIFQAYLMEQYTAEGEMTIEDLEAMQAL